MSIFDKEAGCLVGIIVVLLLAAMKVWDIIVYFVLKYYAGC